MADRIYSAQIKYPWISSDTPDQIEGFLDALFYISPEDTPGVPPFIPAEIEDIGAWLASGQTIVAGSTIYEYDFWVKVPYEPDVYEIDDIFPDTTYLYFQKTFQVVVTDPVTIQTVKASQDDRSVLVANIEQLVAPAVSYDDNSMEPGIVVPCPRKVTQLNLYNEFRASNPSNRNQLPPDFFTAELFPGDYVRFNDGYNCNVSYNESTNTLRLNGGVGFGLGRPDTNPWDDTDEDFNNGVRDVNGLNVAGIVELESAGASVNINASIVGELHIIVINQGDFECPPG
jgi:hypothetical protein